MSSMTPKMWAKWKDYRLYENPDDLIELFEMLEEQGYVPGSIKTPSKFNPAMMKYSSPEAKKLVEKDIQVMGKIFNKASQQSIKMMMDGVKGKKYDAMDLIRGIMHGKAGDTSMGVRDMIRVLWNKVEKRFRSYLGGKKRR
jgi:hypothetical protein